MRIFALAQWPFLYHPYIIARVAELETTIPHQIPTEAEISGGPPNKTMAKRYTAGILNNQMRKILVTITGTVSPAPWKAPCKTVVIPKKIGRAHV